MDHPNEPYGDASELDHIDVDDDAITQDQLEDAMFRHVVTVLLRLSDTDALMIALNDGGYDTVDAILTIKEAELKRFTYTDPDGTSHAVKLGPLTRIHSFHAFDRYKIEKGEQLDGADWLGITWEEYTSFFTCSELYRLMNVDHDSLL